MKRIKVRAGKHTGKYKWMLVDNIDVDLFPNGACLTGKGYAQAAAGLAHRLIAARMGLDAGLQVDHINRRKLDNRRKNLRAVTNGQNRRNSRKGVGKSRYKGVTVRGKGRFDARITVNTRDKFLGTYNTAKEAHKAYKAAVAQYMPPVGQIRARV